MNEVNLSEKTLKFFKGDELRARVFIEKYALRNWEGDVVELTPPEMWERIASEISGVESDRVWYERFRWLLWDFRFIPGGRIMFGAGNQRKVSLLNCYYIPILEDSIEGIFDCAKQMAKTYSYGGGVGIDVTILRPKGSPVSNSAVFSTGAVSFMDLFSKVTGTIGQSGRRGALMISMEVRHPDILDFIRVKNDDKKSSVRFANISVKITDDFMDAVSQNKDYRLWFENKKVRVEKYVKARDVWSQIVKSAHQSAEPGVIFWTTAKRFSPTEYDEKMQVKGVNPCSEQVLEDYGCCNLGNINLTRFVRNRFQKRMDIENFWKLVQTEEKEKVHSWCEEKGYSFPDIIEIEKAVRYAVRFLDDVLDYSKDRHPLEEQTKASMYSRRIGLGVTGLGDFFSLLSIKYDTDDAIFMADKLFEFIKNTAYDESAKIAKEKGSFPAFNKNKHISQPFLQSIAESVLENIEKFGLRNSCLLTIPPVGSGAVLAGTTGGIEPIFAFSYTRRSESLSKNIFRVWHPLIGEYIETFGLKNESELPEFFVTAHQISPSMRVKMQGTIQKHIDSSISSTVNLPRNISPEEVAKIYFQAFKYGCKGITVYREGSREGVLITNENENGEREETKEDYKDLLEKRICSQCAAKLKVYQEYLLCPICGVSFKIGR